MRNLLHPATAGSSWLGSSESALVLVEQGFGHQSFLNFVQKDKRNHGYDTGRTASPGSQ